MIQLSDIKKFGRGAKASILSGIADSAHLLEQFDIDTPLRVSHFMAQIAHESAGFKTTREYASGAAYEGRKDLGNVRRGDGKKFRGRGLIQVTGRANAREFTAWCRSRGVDSPDFEASPQEMEKFPWALLGAVWYWDTRKLNRYADKNDLRGITKRINGGYNGLADRKTWFGRAWDIWGEDKAVQYAGKGKNPLTSKTNLAAGGTVGVSVAATVADQVELGRGIWDSISDLITFQNPLQTILLIVVIGLLGYIIYERVRKAKEFEI